MLPDISRPRIEKRRRSVVLSEELGSKLFLYLLRPGIWERSEEGFFRFFPPSLFRASGSEIHPGFLRTLKLQLLHVSDRFAKKETRRPLGQFCVVPYLLPKMRP